MVLDSQLRQFEMLQVDTTQVSKSGVEGLNPELQTLHLVELVHDWQRLMGHRASLQTFGLKALSTSKPVAQTRQSVASQSVHWECLAVHEVQAESKKLKPEQLAPQVEESALVQAMQVEDALSKYSVVRQEEVVAMQVVFVHLQLLA